MDEPKPQMHTIHNRTPEKVEERKPVDSKKSLRAILIIAGIIIIVIATIIILSKYVFTDKNPGTITYNKYVFEKYEGNKWLTQQKIRNQTYNIPFYYNPTQVLDIPIDPVTITRLRNLSFDPNNTVYISIDPNESSKVVVAGVEYARILGKAYDIYNMNVKSAFNTPVNQTTEYPIITCKNQSRDTIVIIQTVSNKNLISIKGNCIAIEATDANESIRVADAFAFKLLNIIPLST
jgi:hypothetical protein